MILTSLELHEYRYVVGLQLQYADRFDIHKVAELRLVLMDMIRVLAERKVVEATGVYWNVAWSDDAVEIYDRMAVEAMRAWEEGFDAWKRKQIEIEGWVCAYIDQAVIQASMPDVGINKNN